MNTEQKADVAVIGAGAAGMMAAIAAAECGAHVLVLERNAIPGVKLNLTGKGRCNVTNNCGIDDLIANTPGNGRFLYSAFSAFSPQDVMEFFEDRGVPLKVERGNRVFPTSDRAKDITAALTAGLNKAKVTLIQGRAERLLVEGGAVCGIELDSGRIRAMRVILATGGKSYPRTGSDGSGYELARLVGHSIVTPRPSLVPLNESGSICRELEGLSLRNVELKVARMGKVIYQELGEMLFTAQGISGPLVLSASAALAHSGDFFCQASIDLKPALDLDMLDRRLLRDFGENLNRDFHNSLSKLLPSKLIPAIVTRSGIPGDCKVHSITKAQRENLCRLLKNFSVDISSAGSYHEAVVTAGGVSIKEISPKTLESKLVSGLYFAGELMDVDAYTGGFNLQIAWSTGRKAGLSCAQSL